MQTGKLRKDHNQVQEISDEDQVLKSLFKQVNITRTWIIQAQGKMSSEDMNEPLFQRFVSKSKFGRPRCLNDSSTGMLI